MSQIQSLDVERTTEQKGYPALASWIARNPDYDTFVFRRFDKLSARNLLHLESQIAQLEWELDSCDQEAMWKSRNDVGTGHAIRNWEVFSESAKDSNLLEHRQMVLVSEISAKLKEYRKSSEFHLADAS